MTSGDTLTLPHKWRSDRSARFAETSDVLKNPRRQHTAVRVLDFEIGGDEFITMAGPCSVETEMQLLATAHHVRRGNARIRFCVIPRIAVCLVAFVTLCAFVSDPSPKLNIDFIVTAAPAYEPLAALHGQERFPKGAQLSMVHEGKAEALVSDFASTAYANVSFDGSRALFAEKKTLVGPWQVWEIILADHSARQLTFGTNDAIRRLYLPGDRFVFSQRAAKGFQLQSTTIAKLPVDSESRRGSAVLLIFTNANAVPSDVLALSDDKALTSTNIPWIFRLPASTTPADLVRTAVSCAGANRECLRDVLTSGESLAGVAFLPTGEPLGR